MAFKSKDIIRITEMGESLRDQQPLFEFRVLKHLQGNMRVHQIYQVIMDKYPEDYINGSLEFYKVIEVLGSKKLIEKVINKKEIEDFERYFINDDDIIEMTTLASDDVDFIGDAEKEKRLKRRKERWFNLNKNNYQDNSDLEIKVKEKKELNYKHISHVEKNNDNIDLPLDNPFYMTKEDAERQKNEERLKTENDNIQESISFSFVEDDKEADKSKNNNMQKVKQSRSRTDREKYKKKIKEIHLSDKKYKKLQEKDQKFMTFVLDLLSDLKVKIKKIMKK